MRLRLSVFAVLLSLGGFAQSIRGTVKDIAGKAVPYATINLRNSVNNSIIGYAVANAGGAYTLPIPVNAPLTGLVIEATSIGYKAVNRPLSDIRLSYDFTLSVSANQLQAVEIKSSRPVLRMHGDTLGYNVADFANTQDMVIGDVLKKLPGITVGSDGTIFYNNKAISALYINGDNLLDDKYNIATTTIPHSVVEQVQVIQGDQPIKVLQNKVMSENVALNLTIKKGAKMQWVGQERVGAGLPGNYDVDVNAMMFKDNYKAINYLKGNNTGYDLQQELVAHNLSAYEQDLDNARPASLLTLGAVNSPALSRERYLFNQSGLLNLNNMVKFRNEMQVRLNAWYFHDNQRQDFNQQSTIFLPGDTVRYTATQHNRFQPDVLHTQFTLNCNRDKYYCNDVLMLDDNRSAYYSVLNTGEASVTQVLHDHQLNFSNEFNLIKSVKSNHIIQTYSYISHSAEPENRTIGPNYEPAIFNDSNQYTQLIQTVNVPTWYTTNYVSLKIPSNLITQSFKTGFSVQSQILTSGLDVEQEDSRKTPQSDSSTNHLNWTRTKIYAEADYDLDIYQGYILKNYLSLYANSADLAEKQEQRASAGFSYRKSLILLFASLNIGYDHLAADKIASEIITNRLQQQVMLPFPNATGSWTVSSTVSKYSFALKTTFSAGLQWLSTRSVQLQNDQLLPFNTITETGSLAADTKGGDHVAIHYKATLIQTSSHSAVDASANRIDQLQQEASLEYNPLSNLQWKVSGEHYFTRQEGNGNAKYFFADASAKFRVSRWKANFEVSAVNFLNVKTYRAFYLSANTFTASAYTLPGRIVLLKGIFNL